MMCPLCARFHKHLHIIRKLAREERLPDESLDDTIAMSAEAKERIKRRLQTT